MIAHTTYGDGARMQLMPAVPFCIQCWATPISASDPYRLIFYSDRRPATKHVHGYKAPPSSGIAAIILEEEDGIVGGQDEVIAQCYWLRAF